MDKMPTLALLGAEKQAAVSAALAWPERHFLLVSDQPVIDGWNLPNVVMSYATPDSPEPLVGMTGLEWVLLCPRWLRLGLVPTRNVLGSFSLDRVLPWLRDKFGAVVMPVTTQPASAMPQVVKGNHWHRPDATTVGNQLDTWPVEDPQGCGVLYQPFWPQARTVLAVGRRYPNDRIDLGLVAVHSEVCARDDVLSAGETIQDDRLVMLTTAMLQQLGHIGFFTFNWLVQKHEVRLSSVRPVPRAVFATLRRAGLDLLIANDSGLRLARPGHKFTVEIHYSSYQPLVA